MTSSLIIFAMPSLFGVSETKHIHSHTCVVWAVCAVYNWNINYKRVLKMVNNTNSQISKQSTQNNFHNQHDFYIMHTHTHEHKYVHVTNTRLLSDLFINHQNRLQLCVTFFFQFNVFRLFFFEISIFFSSHRIEFLFEQQIFPKINMNTLLKHKTLSEFRNIFVRFFFLKTFCPINSEKHLFYSLCAQVSRERCVHLVERIAFAIKLIFLSFESRLY